MEKSVTLNDKSFNPYLSESKIQARIKELAAEINRDYKNETPLFIAILNGAFMFSSDLFKELTIDCEISFVKIASYQGTKSTGNVKTLIGLDVNVSERSVIILEDIVDTGNTLADFLPVLKSYKPKEIKVATLLFKPKALIHPIDLHYVGFKIENDFVVGYGLDYDGIGRNLREIYKL